MATKTIKFVFIFALIACLQQNVTPSRILAVIPTASYSHQMFFQQIWRELALRGHDVTVITSDPTNETLANFKEISIRDSYVPFREMIDTLLKEGLLPMFFNGKMNKMSKALYEQQFNIPAVRELISNKSEHFDLLMVEHFITPYLALRHRYKCPVIGVMSLDGMYNSHQAMGNPTHAVLYPSAMVPFQENLSLIERISVSLFQVMWNVLFVRNTIKSTNEFQTEIIGHGLPSIEETLDETDMLFINANPLFVQIRPLTPSTINLAGGVHLKKPKPLPENLQKFLDSSPNGAIYFSLGSNVLSKDLPLELRETFLETLSQLPYKVLWKFEDDQLPGKPDNVMITKWAPQQDVLNHPNIKLFITQGGVQSLEECLYSHVPMVVMPFFGDQEANAAKVKAKGLGLTLDHHSLTVNDFKSTVLEAIDNPVYKENVKRLAMQIQDQPMTPLEQAIWWTEYVLRHKGAQHLNGPKIPWWQFYYFDVLAVLGGVLVVVLGIVIGVVKLIVKVVRKVCKRDNRQKVKKL